MKSIAKTITAIALLLASAGPTAAAPVTITSVASDSFEYPDGSNLTGLGNSNAGWTSAWLSDSATFTDFRTSAGTLSYPGITSAGGRIVYFAGTALNDAARTLPLVDSGVVFVRFLAQFGAASGGGTPTLRFSAGGALTGGIGGNGNCGSSPNARYSILDAGLDTVGCTAGSLLGTQSLVLVQIDYTQMTTRLWVNPDLATFDYLNPPAAQTQANGLAPAMDRIALYSRSPASFDELAIFRVAPAAAPVAQPVPGLPWPGVLALGLFILLATAQVHHRRARAGRISRP